MGEWYEYEIRCPHCKKKFATTSQEQEIIGGDAVEVICHYCEKWVWVRLRHTTPKGHHGLSFAARVLTREPWREKQAETTNG